MTLLIVLSAFALRPWVVAPLVVLNPDLMPSAGPLVSFSRIPAPRDLQRPVPLFVPIGLRIVRVCPVTLEPAKCIPLVDDYDCWYTKAWNPLSTEGFGTRLCRNFFQKYSLNVWNRNGIAESHLNRDGLCRRAWWTEETHPRFSHMFRGLALLACVALSGPKINIFVHGRPKLLCGDLPIRCPDDRVC